MLAAGDQRRCIAGPESTADLCKRRSCAIHGEEQEYDLGGNFEVDHRECKVVGEGSLWDDYHRDDVACYDASCSSRGQWFTLDFVEWLGGLT